MRIRLREPFSGPIGPFRERGVRAASSFATATSWPGGASPRIDVNLIYVDPENDVVTVMRWIDGGSIDGFVRRLLAALDQHTQ